MDFAVQIFRLAAAAKFNATGDQQVPTPRQSCLTSLCPPGCSLCLPFLRLLLVSTCQSARVRKQRHSRATSDRNTLFRQHARSLPQRSFPGMTGRSERACISKSWGWGRRYLEDLPGDGFSYIVYVLTIRVLPKELPSRGGQMEGRQMEWKRAIRQSAAICGCPFI